jgi:ligand-binding sensor domain-containing protein
MKKLILSLIILSMVIPLSAQLNFTNYKNQNEIAALAEEGNYIWIGTSGGLLKRNKSTGALVSKYLMKDGLVFDQVTSIAIDHLGNKWIGTTHGVSYYDGVTWTNYYTEDGLKSNSVGDIIIDLEGNVWFGCSSGVTKFDGNEWSSWTMLSTYDLTMDPEGNIWATANTGIIKIDDGVMTQYTTSNSDIASNTTSCIASDNDGNIYVGHTSANTISVFDGTTWTYITGLPTYIYDIAVDMYGHKWVSHCCGSNALSRYDKDNAFVQGFSTTNFINKFIRVILFDDQGNKWFGTDGGLTRYDDSNWSSFSIPNGLTENDIMGVAQHPDGTTWFGTMISGSGHPQISGPGQPPVPLIIMAAPGLDIPMPVLEVIFSMTRFLLLPLMKTE